MRKTWTLMLGATVAWTAGGCDGNEDTTGATGGGVAYAGFALTGDDESDDGFTDGASTDDLSEMVGDDAASDDGGEMPEADETDPEPMPSERPDRLLRTVLVSWGQMRMNPDLKDTPTAWQGRVLTETGALKVARVLRFERGAVEGEGGGAAQDDHLIRDEDPTTVSFSTTTTVHHDGLLLVLALPRDPAAVTGDLVFETEHFTKSIPLTEIARGGVQTFVADDLGNRLVVASTEPHRCLHGGLRLAWERKSERGGVFGGKVYGPRGELAGYAVGLWGEVDGKRRMKGALLDGERKFRGALFGEWTPIARDEDGASGTFRAVWRGRGAVRGVLGGVFDGEDGEGAAVGFWRARCLGGGECRGDAELPDASAVDCSCAPDPENDFDGACSCDAPPPTSCVPPEPSADGTTDDAVE